jgi:hypothetical protein
VATSWPAHQATAEVFVLAGGGRVEGTLLNPEQDPRVNYVVKTAEGVHLTLDGARVRNFQQDTDLRRRYEEFLADLPDTAAGHWDMARRCEQAGLKAEREFHLQRVLKFEPDHTDARHALGYSQVDGRWVKMEEFRRNQGYTRFRGGWRLEQEKRLMEREEDRELEVKDWKRKLKMWRSWLIKQRGNEGEALAAIRAMDRKRCAPALADQLQEEDEHPQLKLLYIEVLGKLESQVAVSAFIDRAIEDPDATVRDRCLDELAKFGSEAAAQAFVKKLDDENNVIVNRAAAGLARLRDPSTTLPLIEALTTRHRQVISPGSGNLGVGFSNGNLSGFSAGNRGPKVIEREVRNQAVLSALTQIHEGVNYAYNKEQWRNWYARQNTPEGINLNRLD